MTTRTLRSVLLAVLALLTVPLSGHEGARATLTLRPGEPRVGEPCRVRIAVTPAAMSRQLGPGISLAADMPMHAMQPVEATLAPSEDESASYEGELTFTMPGPWRIVVRVADGSEVMTGQIEMHVRSEELPPDGGTKEFLFDLLEPVRPTILPPGWVLSGSIAFAATVELFAILFARRRRCRRGEMGSRARVKPLSD